MEKGERDMLQALLTHIHLLLTCRHNGQGLPSSPNFVIALILISSAVAGLAYTPASGVVVFVIHAIFALIWGGRFVSGASILSVIFDIASTMPVSGILMLVMDIYEAICMGALLIWIIAAQRNKGP